MPQAALVIGAVSAVAGTVGSFVMQSKARSEQRRASRLSQQQQQVATRRSRMQAIRRAQIARAQVIASGVASGSAGSSANFGGQSSVAAQTGGNLGFSTQMSGLSGLIGAANQSAATSMARASDLNSVANLGVRAIGWSGLPLSSLYGGQPAQQQQAGIPNYDPVA